MAEESGEPSDGKTQPSQEKPLWARPLLSDEIVEMVISGITAFGYALLLLFGASGFVVLSYVCSYEGVSMVWNGIKTHVGVPIDDILPLEGFGVGAVFGICCFVVCGRGFARLIQSPLERLLVSSTWFWVLLVLCGTLVLASSLAISLCSVGWRPQWSWSWIWRVLLLGLCVSALSVVLRLLWRPAKEWLGGLPLFVAIAIWAVLGIIAFLLAMWWLGRVPFWQLKLDPRKHAENIVKIALTLVGGVGAVAYLVIKYQERQQAGRAEKREKDRIVDTKVQDAINQLGSDKASTRIAGVYALADIADRYKGGYRQRVVDILCGYLRSDRANYALDELGQPVRDASGHLVKSAASDEAVESTILSVMRDRLRKERKDDETGRTIVQTVDDDQLWCACTFDLHEATFHEAVDLKDSTFECVPYFHGTKFERGADFRGTHFAGDADFRGATFARGVYFGRARFAGNADFRGTHFTRGAYFGRARFAGNADFRGTHFTRGAYFGRARFTGNADFRGTHFTRGADFGGARFAGDAYFRGARFAGGADFGGATFAGNAYFGRATFAGGADFRGTHFAGDADFRGARFAGGADFHGARFARGADFRGARFAGDAYFRGARFARGADFRGARFARGAYFGRARFARGAYFRGATFAGDADFRGAYFAGDADFRGATFAGNADFGWAAFAGNADFGWATFARYAYFGGARFARYAYFRGATFAGNAYFGGARFAGDADFGGATFAGYAYFGWATFTRDVYADFVRAEFIGSATFSGIQGQPSFRFEECKFNRKFRGTDAYEWGPIPIPEDNDGLPAGAVWEDFQEEDDKDGGTTNR